MNNELRIMNYKKILFLCFILVYFSFLFIHKVSADSILTGSIDCSVEVNKSDAECQKYQKGDYQLDDFVKIAIRVADFIFGITGSLALLMFVYGGFMFLISSGSTETVNKAKQIIVGAVAGIVIIFTSYMIVGFVFTATGADTTGSSWSKINWFNDKLGTK